MKQILITLCSIFFLSQVSLWANEPIEAEDISQEEVISEEAVAQQMEEVITSEPTDDTQAETIEHKEVVVDPNAPTADETEAAQAEEAELREVGAGEEPMMEE